MAQSQKVALTSKNKNDKAGKDIAQKVVMKAFMASVLKPAAAQEADEVAFIQKGDQEMHEDN